MGALAQTVEVTSAQPGLWERFVRPPHPDHSNPTWHVSPVIDMAAYHFSWAWVLIPMMLAAGKAPFLGIYAFVMGANLAHRHYGLPYAYFDRAVFRMFERKLTFFPQICILMLAATPLLLSPKGAGSIAGQAVGAVVFFSLLWNFWHIYMQKFGILRLYRAKDPASVPPRTPAWVDKYFLLCWIPLYFSYLGPKYKDLILANGSDVRGAASAIISFMEKNESWLVVPSAMVAAGGVCLWLWTNGAPTVSKPRPSLRRRRDLADFDGTILGQSGGGVYCLRVQPCRRVHGLCLGFSAPPLLPAAAGGLP